MTGADYIARVRLTTKAGDVLAMPGETCERVPASSLPWLLAGGRIEPRPATAEEWADLGRPADGQE